MRVDSHMHAYSADRVAYPRVKVDIKPPPEPAEAEDYLRTARKRSIERAVFVQPLFYGADTAYIFDVVGSHPDSFRAVIIGDYQPRSGLDLLRTRIASEHVAGARLHVCADRRSNTSLVEARDIRESVEIIAAAGKAVDLHVTFEQLPFVAALASGYPQTSFVVDHMGYPVPGQTGEETYRTAVDRLAALPNVYAKISGLELKSASGYPFDDMIFFARRTIESFGAGRCMWGSNYPYVTDYTDMAGVLFAAERLVEDQSDLDKEYFFSLTASRVFWGEEAVR